MPGSAAALMPPLRHAVAVANEHIKDGRFGRSLALVASGSSLISGLEVAYEHYKGSYSNPIMYTPVTLSFVLAAASGATVFSRKAQTAMRWTSYITLVDGVIGFGFHVRGIARKPGGWRLPVTNIVMGPPIFAPLLFGTAAYLGVMASYLRREEDAHELSPEEDNQYSGWKRDLQEGRFQKHLAGVAALWAVLSGFEAWYSHFKSRFKIWSQWTPIIMTPIQFGVCVGAIFSEGVAPKLLPASSGLALVNGTIGFGYHVRGILRRSGGTKTWLYNILYGPPVFAPLLFAACGALGLLASLLRREK
jgi:phosphate/sulfate permease